MLQDVIQQQPPKFKIGDILYCTTNKMKLKVLRIQVSFEVDKDVKLVPRYVYIDLRGKLFSESILAYRKE